MEIVNYHINNQYDYTIRFTLNQFHWIIIKLLILVKAIDHRHVNYIEAYSYRVSKLDNFDLRVRRS